MRSKAAVLCLAGLAALCPAGAQQVPLDPRSSIKINLPEDSPVTLLSANLGESHATARGSAVVLDLNLLLTLRNSTPDRVIRGVTLLVLAQEVTPGGKASVSVPTLNVRPGANFPLRVDLRLLRPGQMSGGPLVQVNLDGVLFQDLSFYGPNRLNSRRAMTAWELEAQRDRKYFKSVLAAGGPEGLRQEIISSLVRQSERPRLNVRVARGPVVSAAALGPEHQAKFAFLEIPNAPVEPVNGWALIAGNEARDPRIQVLNRSQRPVRYVEIGWIVRDAKGRDFMAASVPASDPELFLPPGRSGRVLQDTSLKFSARDGEPVAIAGVTGFVNQVEFADGEVWVPNREALHNAQLLGLLPPSPEEQRLSDLYRKKGLTAVIQELGKF